MILKQCFGFLCGIATLLLAPCQGIAISSPDYSKTPVIFVHGSGLSSSTWTPMIAYLEQAGYPKAYLSAIDLKPNEGSNEQAASKFIQPAIERLLQQAARIAQNAKHRGGLAQKVDIVSHSMGAASSRWYAVKLHPERIRTWISIAGSNHGTNALCAHAKSGQGNREMCPAFAATTKESAFQIALNGSPDKPRDETPFGVGTDRHATTGIPPDVGRNILYFTLRIEPDKWIKPADSAILSGAGGKTVTIPSRLPIKETSPGNFLFTKNAGHDWLPKDPDVMHFTALLLAVRDHEQRL